MIIMQRHLVQYCFQSFNRLSYIFLHFRTFSDTLREKQETNHITVHFIWRDKLTDNRIKKKIEERNISKN